MEGRLPAQQGGEGVEPVDTLEVLTKGLRRTSEDDGTVWCGPRCGARRSRVVLRPRQGVQEAGHQHGDPRRVHAAHDNPVIRRLVRIPGAQRPLPRDDGESGADTCEWASPRRGLHRSSDTRRDLDRLRGHHDRGSADERRQRIEHTVEEAPSPRVQVRLGQRAESDPLSSGIGMAVSLVWAALFLSPTSREDFTWFLWAMLVMFFFAGIGNAGTFKQLPMIMPKRQAGGAIGFTAAVASLGPFFVGIALTAMSPVTWFWICAVYCAVCALICWFRYARPGAPFPG